MKTKATTGSVKPCLLDMAFSHFGSKAEFARAMKTSSQNVRGWEIRGTIPTSHALQIERASNGKIKARDVLIENEFIQMGNI